MKSFMGILIAVMGISAWAEERVDNRQDHQEQRIEDGKESGALTTGEAKRLDNQQERIEKREERMRADGNLKPREKLRLERQQDRANRKIFRAKHNVRRGK